MAAARRRVAAFQRLADEGALSFVPAFGFGWFILNSVVQQTHLTTNFTDHHGYRKMQGENLDQINSAAR
jgi:hypothetical protein